MGNEPQGFQGTMEGLRCTTDAKEGNFHPLHLCMKALSFTSGGCRPWLGTNNASIPPEPRFNTQ